MADEYTWRQAAAIVDLLARRQREHAADCDECGDDPWCEDCAELQHLEIVKRQWLRRTRRLAAAVGMHVTI